MDPPFALEIAQEIFPILQARQLCKPNTTIVLQRDRRSAQVQSDYFVLARKHKVGDSIVYFYQPPATHD
jgi:16S rRNA G966 N2-methylase RsmD